jgi:hypothetical protein
VTCPTLLSRTRVIRASQSIVSMRARVCGPAQAATAQRAPRPGVRPSRRTGRSSLRPEPSGVGKLPEPQDLLEHLHQRVRPALRGRAGVLVTLLAGQGLDPGQHGFGLTGRENEAAPHAAVGLHAALEVAGGVRGRLLVLDDRLDPRRQQVPDVGRQLLRVHDPRGDDQTRFGLGERRGIDPADQPGQHLRPDERNGAFPHRLRDPRQTGPQRGADLQ